MILFSGQADVSTRSLIDLGEGAERAFKPTREQVRVLRDAQGFVVMVQPGKDDYPGVTLETPGFWDLSKFGHIAARITNVGNKPIYVALRVDDDGEWSENNTNTEAISLSAGETGTLKTIFGYSYGYKPSHQLKASRVKRVLVFLNKPSEALSFRIESLVAGGKTGERPPVAPDDVRTIPTGGLISKVRTVVDGTHAFRPPIGRWDLREFDAIRVSVRNPSSTPTSIRVGVETNGGDAEANESGLPPGESRSILVPFAGKTPFDLATKTGGTAAVTDSVSAIRVTGKGGVERVDAIRLPEDLPKWLGKRPPVPGDWVRTLSQEFEGKRLDPTIWKVTGENYYDKVSHWSRDNVILGGGVVRLRYSKKRGFHNDDPKRDQSPYASGFLDTYGLWRQRYGYFEARMKLPTAPGLWPAFWMMPDRGRGEQWQRQDTANGGMEFDIMENLTRWGTRRYNVAVHYDGYDKDHKSIGTDKAYARPDKDGYLTCGLLWTPGRAAFYANGREVARWEDARVSDVPSILMFTLPSGGWDNRPLDDAGLPDDFVIDYVRVWQRKDLASSADGKFAPVR